jgi:ABC-type sugar transport system ATPase subunit
LMQMGNLYAGVVAFLVRIFLDKITKIFKKGKTSIVAVKDVTLEIPEKTFVGLLGPSGCGKTTTLRIIAGLEKPSSGRVYFDDIDVTDWDASKRNIAMIFQFPALYPTLSVYDNIAIPLRASKVSEQDIRRQVLEVSEFLGIKDYLSEKASKLDINLRQKVAIAKVMVRDPTVFILDEPLTVVEPKARVELRAKLKEIQLKLGKSMIYVSHDQSEVMTLSDKIAVMNNGEILQYDTPENLYNKPRNTFVGWFIGSPGMNFIDCELIEESGKVYLTTVEGFRYDISFLPNIHDIASLYRKVIFGIRPEHIALSSRGIKAKCLHVERLGNMMVLHVEAYGRKIRAKIPQISQIRVGDEVYIDFNKEKIILFDPKTGKAII